MATEAPSPQAGPSMISRVRSAVIWRSGSQVLTQVVSWSATLIVLRLLAPEDYGLFAMAQVMLVLFNTMNGFGLASALIREEEVSEERLRQTLGMLILLNGGLAVLQFLTAPLVAAYFEQPQVADLLRVQSLLYLATPFIALPHAMLSREINFRAPALVRLVAAIAGAITALGCAVAGLGVWTLVIAPFAIFYTDAIGMMIVSKAPWRPSFRFAGARHIATFGGIMTATQFFWFIRNQSDIIIAGRVLEPHSLGVYTTGLFLTSLLATKFVPPVNEVAYAAYSRQQEDGAAPLIATIRLVMLVALPAYAGMAVVAEPMVLVLLSDKWAEIIAFLPILAVAMGMLTLQILFAPATDARGAPKVALKIAMLGSVIMPVAFLIGSFWGLKGFAWGWVAGTAVLLCATIVISAKPLGLRLGALVGAVAAPLAAALIMAAGVSTALWITPFENAFARLAIGVASGCIIYPAVLLAIAPHHLKDALHFIRHRDAAPVDESDASLETV